jgi:FMN phosphatase YigB (HAD superfamily)
MNDKLIIFDFNRTLYDPDKKRLIWGVRVILDKYFKLNIKMVLISRLENDRKDIIKKIGIEKYFSNILFVKNKNKKLFESFLDKYSARNIYVIGDYLYEEIRYGNMNKMETIWIRNGKFKEMKPQNSYDFPKYEINNISKVTTIIK